MLSVLIVIIYAILHGNFTGQFVAKAAVVGIIFGGIFEYYLRDLRTGDTL